MNERPIGIAILSVLHVLGGLGLLFAQLLLLGNLDKVSGALEIVGVPPILLILGLLLLAGIALVSGVGMWLGTRWGWWCGAFYYVYSIARYVNVLLFLPGLEGLAEDSREAGYYYAKFSIRIVIHFLILLYFFKENVQEFFGTSDVSKGQAIGQLITVTGTIGGIGYVLSWLLG